VEDEVIHLAPFNHAADIGDPRQADEQEALSTAHGATAFMIMRLRSGRIAVLGHMRELHAICDTMDEVFEAGHTIPMNVWRRSSESKKSWDKPVDQKLLAGVDLSALDLDI
jgi:hypothetical protein